MDTTTQQRLTALFATMDQLGFPVESKQGVWRQLHCLTPAGRANLLARWEATAETWPAKPIGTRARKKLANAEYVV